MCVWGLFLSSWVIFYVICFLGSRGGVSVISIFWLIQKKKICSVKIFSPQFVVFVSHQSRGSPQDDQTLS